VSQENVEVVQEAWALYEERGVDGGIDAFAEHYADDAVIADFPELPDRRTYVGPAGVRERYWHFVETWGDFTIEPVEFIDLGDESVAVVTTMAGRGPGSGLPLDAAAVFVYELRERKIVRDRAFMSRSAALKAVGLSE